MEIERQRARAPIARAKVPQQRVAREVLRELHRRRIRGVTRSRHVVLADQIEVDVKAGGHVLHFGDVWDTG
jgi:hypothetical protein